MSEEVKMNLGVALVLDEVTKMLLYKKTTDVNGKTVLIDRDIPFRLRYRLNKNKLMLDKDVEKFNNTRLLALARYGEATEDEQNVVIKDPEKQELFKQEISNLVDSEVKHYLTLLDPADIDLLKDTDMPVSPEAMGIFINYMVDDPDLEKDFKLQVNVVTHDEPKVETPKTEEPVVAETTEVKVKEKPAVETKPKTTTKKVEPKTTTEKPVKKTTTKKTTTKKKVTK